MTLVELLVTLAILSVIMIGFFLLYFALSGASTDTVGLAETQGQARNVVRALESDLASADPLTIVPTSFSSSSLATGLVTSSGTNGTTPTDVVAMYESDDRFSPCAQTVTATTVPTPLYAAPYAPNVIWAYNASTGTLTRYSYCAAYTSNNGWEAGMSLSHITSSSGTMFTVVQSSSTAETQDQIPTTTTIVNQAPPACGASVLVAMKVDVNTKTQLVPFKVRVTVALLNQGSVISEGCG